jgi:hypothetical protein
MPRRCSALAAREGRNWPSSLCAARSTSERPTYEPPPRLHRRRSPRRSSRPIGGLRGGRIPGAGIGASVAFRLTDKVGLAVSKSHLWGTGSTIFGNSTLGIAVGILNKSTSRVAIGWSVIGAKVTGTTSMLVFRISVRTSSGTGHYNLMFGPSLY